METPGAAAPKSSILPAIGTWKYHLLLSAVAILVLGPLGGITAAYMNFSLGFFVGGQVLAGILGSVITYGYGPEGKHGANYMQTMAASVAGMAAMGVLTQAMVWLGLPSPSVWSLIVYFLCIGMFGVGVGMLYTPMLVDKMQLTYPSGLAVANILRALTDKRLLKRSVAQLGLGTGSGFGLTLIGEHVAAIASVAFSASTFGAGMVVGARITIPAVVIGVIGDQMTPWLRMQGYLGPEDPFRKVGFLVALGSIMGAAAVDLVLIFHAAIKRFRDAKASGVVPPKDGMRNISTRSLAAWIGLWGTLVVVTGVTLMNVPVFYMVFAVALSFLFVMINGISVGISDSNPISSAFVVSIILMTIMGLTDPGTGLLAGAVLLIATSVGCDMQQDRSTGWRLGSDRVTQFRYQVIGITMGAVCAVVITKLFMNAYPALSINTFDHPEQKVAQWQSAMTYKFVGALQGITQPDPMKTKFLMMGLGIGLVLEVARKLLKANAGYRAWKDRNATTKAVDFLVDAVLIPSPYAASFGGFVGLATCLWFGAGGVIASIYNEVQEQTKANAPQTDEEVPEDMSTMSLLGGGLIAGESLAALTLGILGLLATLGG